MVLFKACTECSPEKCETVSEPNLCKNMQTAPLKEGGGWCILFYIAFIYLEVVLYKKTKGLTPCKLILYFVGSKYHSYFLSLNGKVKSIHVFCICNCCFWSTFFTIHFLYNQLTCLSLKLNPEKITSVFFILFLQANFSLHYITM